MCEEDTEPRTIGIVNGDKSLIVYFEGSNTLGDIRDTFKISNSAMVEGRFFLFNGERLDNEQLTLDELGITNHSILEIVGEEDPEMTDQLKVQTLKDRMAECVGLIKEFGAKHKKALIIGSVCILVGAGVATFWVWVPAIFLQKVVTMITLYLDVPAVSTASIQVLRMSLGLLSETSLAAGGFIINLLLKVLRSDFVRRYLTTENFARLLENLANRYCSHSKGRQAVHPVEKEKTEIIHIDKLVNVGTINILVRHPQDQK